MGRAFESKLQPLYVKATLETQEQGKSGIFLWSVVELLDGAVAFLLLTVSRYKLTRVELNSIKTGILV